MSNGHSADEIAGVGLVFPRADRPIAVEYPEDAVITLHPIEGLEKRANSVGTCREGGSVPVWPLPWTAETGYSTAIGLAADGNTSRRPGGSRSVNWHSWNW